LTEILYFYIAGKEENPFSFFLSPSLSLSPSLLAHKTNERKEYREDNRKERDGAGWSRPRIFHVPNGYCLTIGGH